MGPDAVENRKVCDGQTVLIFVPILLAAIFFRETTLGKLPTSRIPK